MKLTSENPQIRVWTGESRIMQIAVMGTGAVGGYFKPSMLQELEAEKPLEVDAFDGVVIKLLLQAGKVAPTNQSFYAMLKYLEHRLHQEA